MGDNFRLRDHETKGNNLATSNQEYKARVTALAEEIDRLNGYLLQRGNELETLRHQNFSLQTENRMSIKEESSKDVSIYKQKIGALSHEIERLQGIIGQMQEDEQ